MSIEKQAAEAVNMLVDEGVDFDTAADLVMEKVATFGEQIRGAVSPAWMEAHIAKKHGKSSPDGFGRNYGVHVAGKARQTFRAIGEGIAGAVGGGLAGKLVGKGAPGAVLGGVAGMMHGHVASTANQAKEMHDVYREKQAAVNMLIEQGVDFDYAVDLVNSKSSELYGD